MKSLEKLIAAIGFSWIVLSSVIVASAQEPKSDDVYEITGICKDHSGKPISAADVKIMLFDSSASPADEIAQTKSGDDGGFEFLLRKDIVGNKMLAALVTSPNHATQVRYFDPHRQSNPQLLQMSPRGTLVGMITAPDGKPVEGALVSVPTPFAAIEGVLSSRTDKSGKFKITDAHAWEGDPGSRRSLVIEHSDHPKSMVWFGRVPQIIRRSFPLGGRLRGRVIDDVTGKVVPNAVVSAQGIGSMIGAQTKTDEKGWYEFHLLEGRYNIWSATPDRVPIAVEAYPVIKGVEFSDVDIHMVRGATIVGAIAPSPDEKIPEGITVGHHGPARPNSGAAVTSTKVKSDGSFQLQVAPGENFLYVMNGSSSVFIDVDDEETKHVVLTPGHHAKRPERHFPLFRQRVIGEMMTAQIPQPGNPVEALPRIAVGRKEFLQAQDLIKKLYQLNANPKTRHSVEWMKTIKEIVDLGPRASPVLIEEFRGAYDPEMIRCLGFIARANDDPRLIAVVLKSADRAKKFDLAPVVISVNDPDLLEFAKSHAIKASDTPDSFYFGSPGEEIKAAIDKLSTDDE